MTRSRASSSPARSIATLAALLVTLAPAAARADYLTLQRGQLLALEETAQLPVASPVIDLLSVTGIDDTTVRYIGTLGTGIAPPIPDAPAMIFIGAPAADIFPSTDLTGRDFYGLSIKNLDDDRWDVGVFIETAADDLVLGELRSVGAMSSTTVDLDLTGLDLSDVTSIGFVVGSERWSNFTGDSADPSNPDFFRMDVSPVPEPATMALFGLAAAASAGAARRRRRRRGGKTDAAADVA